MRCTALFALLGAAALTTGCGGAKTERPAKAPGANAPRVFLIIGENTSASQITAAHAPTSSIRSAPTRPGDQLPLVHPLQLTGPVHRHDLGTVHPLRGQQRPARRVPPEHRQRVLAAPEPPGAPGSSSTRAPPTRATSSTTARRGRRTSTPPTTTRRCTTSASTARATTRPSAGRRLPRAQPLGRDHGAQRHLHPRRGAPVRQGRRRSTSSSPTTARTGTTRAATNDPVRQFDAFLAREVPKVRASPAYGANSTIVITWDEGADPPLNPGNPLLVALGPKVKTGVVEQPAPTTTTRSSTASRRSLACRSSRAPGRRSPSRSSPEGQRVRERRALAER